MLSKLFVLLSFVLLASCSKEVSNKNTNLAPNPTSRNPATTIPSTGSYFNVNFANHATVQEEDDLITYIVVNNSGVVEIPRYISSITFENVNSKPNIALYVNQTLVCVYIWQSTVYTAQPSCQNIQLLPNDVLYMDHIPRSQTVSLSMLVK